MSNDSTSGFSSFELATRELRVFGVALTRLPGEYRINLLNGSPVSAVTCADFGILAADLGIDKGELLRGALNDLFDKHGKPPIA